MKRLNIVKGCECEHCLRKLKQIKQSRIYWNKIACAGERVA